MILELIFGIIGVILFCWVIKQIRMAVVING